MWLLFFCHIFQSLDDFLKNSFLLPVAYIALNNVGTSGDASTPILSQGYSLLGRSRFTLVTGSAPSYPLLGGGSYKCPQLLNERPIVQGDELAWGSHKDSSSSESLLTAFQTSVGTGFLSVPPGCLPFHRVTPCLLSHFSPHTVVFSLSKKKSPAHFLVWLFESACRMDWG